MKPLALIAGIVAAFIAGMACAPGKVITKTVEKPVTVETPGPVITDTAEIARLTSLLTASEAKSQERLEGWRKAEARYLYYEKYYVPQQPKRQAAQPVSHAGAQGSAGAVYQPRSLFRGRFR